MNAESTQIAIKEELEICDYEINSTKMAEELLQNKESRVNHNVINTENGEELNIIEERSDMITVSVGKLYSEDERNFITSLDLNNMLDPAPKKICRFCQMSFKTVNALSEHKKFSQCRLYWLQLFSCPACSVVYESESKLFKHTRLHQRNMHFCQMGCGKFFRKLECCLDHEHRHDLSEMDQLKCRGCYKTFSSRNKLTQHLNQHLFVRRFVCSLCRLHFNTGSELAQHWVSNRNSCGVVKYDSQIISSKGEYVLADSVASKKRKLDSEISFELSNHTLTSDSCSTAHFQEENKKVKEEHCDYVNENDIDTENKYDGLINTNIKYEFSSDFNDNCKNNRHTTSETSNSDNDSEWSLKNSEPYKEVRELSYISAGSVLDISKLRLPSIKKHQSVEISKSEDSNSNLNVKNFETKCTTATNKKPNIFALNSNSNRNSCVHVGTSESAVNSSKSFKVYRLPLNTKILSKQITENTTTLGKRDSNNFKDNLSCNSHLKNLSQQNQTLKLPLNIKIVPFNGMKLIATPNNIKKETDIQTADFSSAANKNSAAKLQTVKLANVEICKRIKDTSVSGIIGNELEQFDPHTEKLSVRRNLCLTNDTMMLIESLPEKRKVIEDIKNQIRVIEQASPKNIVKDTPSVSPILENNANANQANHLSEDEKLKQPSSLYLKINITHDQGLMEARRKYPDYRFSWMCPHCPRQYELKYAFRGHLVSMHGATKESIDQLQIEVRPFKLRNPLITQKDFLSMDSQLQDEKVLVPSKKDTKVLMPLRGNESDTNTETKQKFVCQKCQSRFASADHLTQHLKESCSRPKRYECSVCSKRFAASGTLNCHMTIHSGELPHKCNFCDKRFRTRGQVTVHHRTHTGERPFTCQVCLLGFTHRETLISHLSRHIGMKRYKCYGCDKTFSCISGLRTHRDVRPETCGRVKFSPRAIGPRVRVVKGNVIFESQPHVNPYLRSENPPTNLT